MSTNNKEGVRAGCRQALPSRPEYCSVHAVVVDVSGLSSGGAPMCKAGSASNNSLPPLGY